MSKSIDETVKRWIAKRKTALVIAIIQGKTTAAEASRAYDLTPSEIEGWVDDANKRPRRASSTNLHLCF
ncbi:DUF1153 domain-containing protein [Donghicola eburneus]|uniref:DUF1153 domain-containing protein n=1 Tax=Donghicola eburneus TaxID=393278 RepID=UPI0008E55776|nr:DUF1153 domain-containing protein [Donghicola eburneus]SFQ75422.1 Protein of unknown function [Donghicola eburneus]